MKIEKYSRDRPTKARASDKLMTEGKAKAAASAKLQNEKTFQLAAGEKLRFEKAVFEEETENTSRLQRKMKQYGKKTQGKKPSGSKVSGSRTQAGKTLGGGHVSSILSNQIHQEVDNESDDNVGVDAANRTSQIAERTADSMSNAFSRWRQKHDIRKAYAAQKAGRTSGGAVGSAASLGGGTAAGTGAAGAQGAKGAGKAVKEGKNLIGKAGEFITAHGHALPIGGGIALILILVTSMLGSCGVFFQGSANVVIDTSYTAEDEDILGAEADYEELEKELQSRLDNIRTEYAGYDEYNITSDQIGHNPYELASYLTVLFENYSRREVKETLQALIDLQYELSVEEVVETRYRTETRTGTRTVTNTVKDPLTGEEEEVEKEEKYEYEVEVPYQYYILNVHLTNRSLGVAIARTDLNEDQMERYVLLNQTHGNRPDLFGESPFAIETADPLQYDIPGEALTSERFRKMITEAECYLGYPYVWGGASPSTSFDCSGYVSWVINHCGNGWSYGRKTAEGLRKICSIVPRSEAQPGDLIFFQGTYNTAGASHVGIYVGNGMMIHCGNPIQYASVETRYWQSHFYCFGRLP